MEVASHLCLALFGAIFEKFSVQDSLLAPGFANLNLYQGELLSCQTMVSLCFLVVVS